MHYKPEKLSEKVAQFKQSLDQLGSDELQSTDEFLISCYLPSDDSICMEQFLIPRVLEKAFDSNAAKYKLDEIMKMIGFSAGNRIDILNWLEGDLDFFNYILRVVHCQGYSPELEKRLMHFLEKIELKRYRDSSVSRQEIEKIIQFPQFITSNWAKICLLFKKLPF